MNPGGDAAEQIVRLSLEGVEVAAKISGNGAKNIGLGGNEQATHKYVSELLGKRRIGNKSKTDYIFGVLKYRGCSDILI